MSEQRTDLDEVVDRLRGFEAGDTVTLVTDAGSITAKILDARWDRDGARVTLVDRDADRRVRVSTEWYGGWLDPLVDTYPADGSERLRSAGTLVDVHLVAADADQPRQRGRP